MRVRANGQEAMAFYSWDPEGEAYVPFALNVLTFRGELISDVTAFIIRTRRRPMTARSSAHARAAREPAQPRGGVPELGVPDRLD